MEIFEKFTEQYIAIYVAIVMATWVAMIVATMVDMWSAVDRARAKREMVLSSKLRKTIKKMLDYWKVQLLFFVLDVFGSLFYSLPYFSLLCMVIVVGIEIWSVRENLAAKKSEAADVLTIIENIINASDKEQAKQILKELNKKAKR